MDSDNNGSYVIQGNESNRFDASSLDQSQYSISTTIPGSGTTNITIKIDRDNPVISSVSIVSNYADTERQKYFTQGDTVTLSAQITDANITISDIVAKNLSVITGNSDDDNKTPTSYAGNIATWSNISVGTGISDGEKRITINAIDKAGNERLNNDAVITADYSDLSTAVTLTSPANNVYINQSRPTLQWNDLVSDEKKYFIEISRNNNFTDIVYTKTIEDNQAGSYNFQVDQDLPDYVYYWQVYGIDAVGHESPHKTSGNTLENFRMFQIDTVAPPINSVSSRLFKDEVETDTGNSYGVGDIVKLKVNTNVQDYDVSLNINSVITSYNQTIINNIDYDGLGNYSYLWNTSGLSDADDYIVTWTLTDTAGNTATDNSLQISIDALAPGEVIRVSPVSGTKVNTATPTFTWQDLGEDEEKYILMIDDNNNFSSPLNISGADNIGKDTTSFTIPGGSELSQTTYYWKVYAEDAQGNFNSNIEAWSFTVDTDKPEIVSVSPDNAQTNVSVATNIEVVWTEALDQTTVNNTNFRLERNDSGVYTEESCNVTYSSTSGYKVNINPDNNLRYEQEYRLTVNNLVLDTAGNSHDGIAYYNFTTQRISSMTNLSASDNPKDTGGKIKITWTALTDIDDFEKYTIYYKQSSTAITEGELDTIDKTDITQIDTSDTVLSGFSDNTDYVFAITVSTTYGAISELGASALSGPVQSIDDAVVCQDGTYAEIRPVNVAPLADVLYSMYIKPLFLAQDSGFDKMFVIQQNHTDMDVSESKLFVDGEEWTLSPTPSDEEFYPSINGDTIEITFGKIVDYDVINNKSVRFDFKAKTPSTTEIQSVFGVKIRNVGIGKDKEISEGYADNDNFNENTLTTLTTAQINDIKAEVNPQYFGLNSKYKTTVDIRPVIENGNIGFDKIIIDVPAGYTAADVTSWKVYNDDQLLSDAEFTNTDDDTVEIKLPFEVNFNTVEKDIKVELFINTPVAADTATGSELKVYVDNERISKKIPVLAGNANNVTGGKDSDSLTIYSGTPANAMYSEIHPFKGGVETQTQYTVVFFQQYNSASNTGVDKFDIILPAGFTNLKFTAGTDFIKGKDREYTLSSTLPIDNTQAFINVVSPTVSSPGTLEIQIGEKYRYHNETFEVSFTVDNPENGGDYTVSAKAGNRDVNDMIDVVEGDIDGNSSNNNSPDAMVLSITSPADEVYAEITPHVIKPSATSEISVFTKINTGTGSGIDTIIIDTEGINSFDVTPSKCYFDIDGNVYNVIDTGTPLADEVLVSTEDEKITLSIGGVKITGNNRTAVFRFEIESSNVSNYPTGALWIISADDSAASHAVIAEPDDVDLMPSNGNNLFLYTGNSLADTHPYAELYVTDSSGLPHFDSIVNGIKAGSVRNIFNYTIRPAYSIDDIGIDKITVNTQTHVINDITSVKVNVGGIDFTPIYAGNPQSGQALVNYSAPTMEITLGDRIYYGNPTDPRIFIIFEADAPVVQDSGVLITSSLDYTWLNDSVDTVAGDADALDSTDSLSVVTKQSPVNRVLSEISPANANISRAREKFTLRFKPEINAVNSGFSRFSLQIPSSYSNLYIDTTNNGSNQSLALECSAASIKSVLIDPQNEGEARIVASGNTITVFLADNVYNSDGTGTDYNNSLWTMYFYANTPQDSDYTNNGDPSDDGKDFVLTIDNRTKPLPVIAEAGEADGNVSTPGTMRVVAAPGAKSLIAEAKAVSVNGVTFINNDIIKNSTSNRISVCTVPEIDSSTRGINRVKITIPSEFTNPYFSELRIDGNVVTPSNTPAQINGIDNIDVKFPLVTDISRINIDFQVDVNNVEASGQKLSVKGYYNDDSYEVTATSGDDTGGSIGTQSLSFNIISVPARGAVSEIADNNTVIFRNTENTFTLYVKPEITVQDSGIDTVTVFTPSNLYRMLSVESVEWNGSILVNTSGTPGIGEYSHSVSDTSITIVSGSQLIENNKLIKIRFKAEAPEYTDIPSGNDFSGHITLSGSDKTIAFVAGNADNTQISNTLNVKVTSVVKTVRSEITPSYVVKGKNNVVFDYYIESDIPADAVGFDKIKIPVPQGYSLNEANELHVTDIASGNTQTFAKVAGVPAAGQYFYEISNGFMIFTLNASDIVDYNSRVRIRFIADVPNMNVIQDIYALVENSINNIQDKSVAGNSNSDESDWNTYTLSSASAEVSEASAKALFIENGKWKISLSLKFNTLMDVESVAPKVTVENVQAITTDYVNSNGEGLWTGVIYLNASDFNGIIDIQATGAKDTQGNTVNSSIVSLAVEYGVSASLFINPVDSKLFSIIARVSSQLPLNYSLKAEVKETGYAMETVNLSTGFNKTLYSGIYRIKSSKNITLNIKIYDNDGNSVNSAPEVEILQNNTAPLYITQKSFIKIQDNNVKILKGPANSVFSHNIPEELERVSDIVTFEKSQSVSFMSDEINKNTGLYFFDGEKWISDKEYKGQEVFSAGVFTDTKAPELSGLPVQMSASEYSFKLTDISGIHTVTVNSDREQCYSEIDGDIVRFIISDYSPIIQVTAEDNRGNILRTSAVMKAPAGSSDLRVYPVPAKNSVSFDNRTASSYNLKIYDVSGRTVYSARNLNGFFVWDVADRRGNAVSNGVYYYKLEYSDGTENTGKIAVLK